MVQILDTTLREGEQTPGVYFDNHIKLVIADLLDELGVDYIEAGHPIVSKDVYQSVKQIAGRNLNAIIGAHSRSLKKDVDDALDCGVRFLGLFYCVSDERLNSVYNKSLDKVKSQIAEIITYAKAKNPRLIVRYTPEDTVRSEFKNVIEVSVAAVEAGADIISIADTTGYMIPGTKRSMYDYVDGLKQELASRGLYPKIAVHCHNDRGLALANALDGYRAGADIIDATVLSLGERTGLVDLATLLTVLKADFEVENNWELKKLPELYMLVSRYSNIPIPVNSPIIGENAFTHCAGIHTQAALKNPIHYQSLDPTLVGRESRISLDHMSGMSSVRYALEQIGVQNPDETLLYQILEQVKTVGKKRTVSLSELKHIVNGYGKNNGNNGNHDTKGVLVTGRPMLS